MVAVIHNVCVFSDFQMFSPLIRLMLTHQSFVDGAACLFATILLLQPLNWVPGIKYLDHFICHIWDGQIIYWATVFVSSELKRKKFRADKGRGKNLQ